MNYNVYDALDDCRALVSLIDHHHAPLHIMIDNSITYVYAVKCRYITQKKENLHAGKQSSYTIHNVFTAICFYLILYIYITLNEPILDQAYFRPRRFIHR